MRKRTSDKFESEVELAAAVCAWLEAGGFEVFKEIFTYDGEIDIVARCPGTGILWGIETKLRLTNQVCAQAHKRLLSVHYTSVAAQLKGRDEIDGVQEEFLNKYGIGVISVTKHDPDHRRDPNKPLVSVEEIKEPRLTRPHDLGGIHSPNRWRRDTLKPTRVRWAKGIAQTRTFLMKATKETIAGAPGGGQFTPWKRTVVLLKEFLAKNGKAQIQDILDHVDHHYRSKTSARNGITKIMGDFEKAHFEMIREGKEIYWKLRTTTGGTDGKG